MSRLFGTDGVRGVAGTELSAELALKIGMAAAVVLTKDSTAAKPLFLIGRDTRISGQMLETALAAGITAMGGNVLLLGVSPTPAVAYLVKRRGAVAGIMISASHNPYEDNGIKIFSSSGFKLSDSVEDEIQSLIESGEYQKYLKTGGDIGGFSYDNKANAEYIKHVASTINGNLEGMRIVVDCANGSASATAEPLFKMLGCNSIIINDHPTGKNINRKCGSTDLSDLIRHIKIHKCHLGLAFDGDADRCLAVDEDGNVVDGDGLLAIFAKHFKNDGWLTGNTVVVTVMTNFGFYRFAEDEGINVISASVGDRYVLEEMQKGGFVLGGEQSGHIIFSEFSSTGDGQLTAVQLVKILQNLGNKRLSYFRDIFERVPQFLFNIKFTAEGLAAYDKDNEIKAKLEEISAKFGNDGRILVRKSGTEPLVRIMTEGLDAAQASGLATEAASFIKARLKKHLVN
jgi:phosphoglucosamine mutase